jgi:hypothetical protein
MKAKFVSNYNNKLKISLILLSSLILSACSSASFNFNSGPFDFYLLNTKTGSYCKRYLDEEIKGPCQNLVSTLIYPHETRVIENIYQQELDNRSKIGSLINIILRGDHLDYTATQIDNNIYRLPINQQTDTVWDVLDKTDLLTNPIK